MRKTVTLITGANGEIGHGLLEHFARVGGHDIVALDLKPLDEPLRPYVSSHIVGDILDRNLFAHLISEYEIHAIFHLAALLSTRAEYTPDTAHRVNVEGTLNLLQLATEQSSWHGHTISFLFPSSIAVYGLPDAQTKYASPPVREIEWNFPTTMYGCNKLYCEQLGRYFSDHYRQLAAEKPSSRVDFRAIRFPGIISADTMPTGGTSDFAPEMLHAAAQGSAYDCFVHEHARIPFMAMPDAIRALVLLARADAGDLGQRVYNVSSFAPSAGEIAERVRIDFPESEIDFRPDPARQAIIETWPAEVDDTAARSDWGWEPELDFDHAFSGYLVPRIRRRYQN